MPADDRPYTMGDYRTEIIVIAHPDRTVIRRPDMDEPLVLRPGERVRLGFGCAVTVEGYVDGIGWEAQRVT